MTFSSAAEERVNLYRNPAKPDPFAPTLARRSQHTKYPRPTVIRLPPLSRAEPGDPGRPQPGLHHRRRVDRARLGRLRGALLVAPADTDRRPFFDRVPLRPLPFPSILVASENDPHLELGRAKRFAQHWGSRLVNLGRAGHINVESGFGPWPKGEALLAELRAGAWCAPAGSSATTAPDARPAAVAESEAV